MPGSDKVASQALALTNMTLELPPRVTARGAGVAAKGSLSLADNVKIQVGSTAFGGVVNLSGTTTTGRNVVTGDLWSQGSVTHWFRSSEHASPNNLEFDEACLHSAA